MLKRTRGSTLVSNLSSLAIGPGIAMVAAQYATLFPADVNQQFSRAENDDAVNEIARTINQVQDAAGIDDQERTTAIAALETFRDNMIAQSSLPGDAAQTQPNGSMDHRSAADHAAAEMPQEDSVSGRIHA